MVLTICSLDPLDSPLQVVNQNTHIFQGSVSVFHNLRAFLSDATKGNFLLFVDPFHKQIYQIDFTDSNPTPEGIHLPESINYPEYFDIDIEAKVLYYANKLDKVITSLDMQTWRDESIKQFNYGKSSEMQCSKLLRQRSSEFFHGGDREGFRTSRRKATTPWSVAPIQIWFVGEDAHQGNPTWIHHYPIVGLSAT